MYTDIYKYLYIYTHIGFGMVWNVLDILNQSFRWGWVTSYPFYSHQNSWDLLMFIQKIVFMGEWY